MLQPPSQGSPPSPAAAPPVTIAIDGPVASGKTAVGKALAKRLGARFVDTGQMYRAATAATLDRGIDPKDEISVAEIAEVFSLDLVSGENGDRLLVDGLDVTDRLREPAVDRAVSFVSRVPKIRTVLVERQREIAADGPTVMVGRDIGTVVLPKARVKVYLDAAASVRAKRRHGEMMGGGESSDIADVISDMERRDTIDSQRADSPLRPAANAAIIETDELSVEEVVSIIVDLAANP